MKRLATTLAFAAVLTALALYWLQARGDLLDQEHAGTFRILLALFWAIALATVVTAFLRRK